jgi:hypothetical protein
MEEVQRDLFGKKVKPKYDKLAQALKNNDKQTFEARLKRLRYLDNMLPPDSGMAGLMEPVQIFEEARLAFLNGAFIATILLCQAFIEHWLAGYISATSKKAEIPSTLEGMLKLCSKEGLMHTYIVEKINYIRLVRNPLTHPKSFDYPYSLSQRLFKMIREEGDMIERRTKNTDIGDLLEQDAKSAIEIMHILFVTQPIMLR